MAVDRHHHRGRDPSAGFNPGQLRIVGPIARGTATDEIGGNMAEAIGLERRGGVGIADVSRLSAIKLDDTLVDREIGNHGGDGCIANPVGARERSETLFVGVEAVGRGNEVCGRSRKRLAVDRDRGCKRCERIFDLGRCA